MKACRGHKPTIEIIERNKYLKALNVKMTLEEEIIRTLKNPTLRGDLKYLALDLIRGNYDSSKLIELAKNEGVHGQLGYLTEVTAIASEKAGIPGSNKLYELSKSLLNSDLSWQYLNPNLPDFAKRMLCKDAQTELNKKWKVWTRLVPEEMKEWVSLYLSRGDYEKKQEHGLHRQTESSFNYPGN